MLTHPTLDQLRALKLDGMAQAFVELEAQDEVRQSRPRRMAGAVARPRVRRSQHPALPNPAAHRSAAPQPSRDRGRRLPHPASARQSAVPAVGDLSRWIAEHRNLLVTGPCGVGKSWLSCALAQKACRDGYTVHSRACRACSPISISPTATVASRGCSACWSGRSAVLDDWGPDRLSASHRRDLMEIARTAHGRGSILITSQLPVATWLEVIAEPTLGDAILDRIVHNAYRLELDGPSMRKVKASEEAGPAPSSVTTTAADGKSIKGAKK